MSDAQSIIAVIPAKPGYRVIVRQEEFLHAQRKHFLIPASLLLSSLETVLRDPTAVFVDSASKQREHHILYRLESGEYIAVVVKLTEDGVFFCSMYPTGTDIRKIHRGLRRLKL
jgi:hypothetical protein